MATQWTDLVRGSEVATAGERESRDVVDPCRCWTFRDLSELRVTRGSLLPRSYPSRRALVYRYAGFRR